MAKNIPPIIIRAASFPKMDRDNILHQRVNSLALEELETCVGAELVFSGGGVIEVGDSLGRTMEGAAQEILSGRVGVGASRTLSKSTERHAGQSEL